MLMMRLKATLRDLTRNASSFNLCGERSTTVPIYTTSSASCFGNRGQYKPAPSTL